MPSGSFLTVNTVDSLHNEPSVNLLSTVQEVSCVVHYQLPASADVYVHRSGRTARAAQEGIAIALVTPQEAGRYQGLQKALNRPLPEEFPVDSSLMPAVSAPAYSLLCSIQIGPSRLCWAWATPRLAEGPHQHSQPGPQRADTAMHTSKINSGPQHASPDSTSRSALAASLQRLQQVVKQSPAKQASKGCHSAAYIASHSAWHCESCACKMPCCRAWPCAAIAR